MSNRIKAVVFDFDDTLVDELSWIKNRWKKTIRFAETTLQIDDFGMHFWFFFKEKGPKYRFHVNDALRRAKSNQVYVKPIVRNFLQQQTRERLLPGVRQCLRKLKKHYKLAILTNGRQRTQLQRIRSADLDRYFDIIVCAYKNPKPSLRPYRECLKKLKVTPSESMYISHDPEIDLEGAREAGMATVLYAPGQSAKHDEADIHVKSFRELAALLINGLQQKAGYT